MTVENPHKRAAQTRKALALADVLDAQDADPDAVERMDRQGWFAAAELANVASLPSEEVRQMVVSMLRGRRAERARLEAAGGDPFEGIAP